MLNQTIAKLRCLDKMTMEVGNWGFHRLTAETNFKDGIHKLHFFRKCSEKSLNDLNKIIQLEVRKTRVGI